MPGIDNPLMLDVPTQFETERLILRAHILDDLQPMNAAMVDSHEVLSQWMPFAADAPQPIEDTEAFIRRNIGFFATRQNFGYSMLLRSSRRYIGNIGVHPQNWQVPSFSIGYWLNTAEAGNGYISEATQFLTDYFINVVGARRMIIRCDSRNKASSGVAKKCGYTLEGLTRHSHRDNRGELFDMEWYSIALPDPEK